MKRKPNLYRWIGNPLGHYTKKENRAQKLLDNYEVIDSNLTDMAERGSGDTDGNNLVTARLALASLLMLYTGLRVGNEGSADGYRCNLTYHKDYGKVIKTYGLTTLRKKHFKYNGKFLIDFIGKKNVRNMLEVKNQFLVKHLKRLLRTKEQKEVVFNYTVYDLTKFIKQYIGRAYTPKDLRLAYANLLFIEKVQKVLFRKYQSISEVKRSIKETFESVAEVLGNTHTVCRRSYVSPLLVEKCLEFQKKQLES